MLVNIMVYKLVLIEACFDPLSYYFFLNPHPIVNKKIHGIKILTIFAQKQFIRYLNSYISYETVQG